MKSIHPNIIRQVFVLSIIVLLFALIFKEIAEYLPGVLGALTLYVIFKKPMEWLMARNWSTSVAAITLMVTSFIVILLPVIAVILMLGSRIKDAIEGPPKIMDTLKEYLQKVQDYTGFNLQSKFDFEAISDWVSNNLQGFAGGTFATVISIGVMYFLLYYMLTNRNRLKESLYEYLPIANENLKQIGKEVKQMVLANALGIPLVALAQGVVALIGFFIFGVENPVFWAVIVAVGSMIPFVGSALGTIPVFLMMLSQGNTFAAWGVLIYGFVVVGSADNLIRMYVLQRLDNVHPLITLIGILVGIPLFGFIGLIFGPLLVSLFLVVVRIYKSQYGAQAHAENT
ncbi:AI-2E family transporter [Flagellimonas iocasae]|uniref:AI-2E family transporter n=1 Tax=Flagellimonas iocasae TaxID=2055905 RepID=A0ABW4Y548_9FLAO